MVFFFGNVISKPKFSFLHKIRCSHSPGPNHIPVIVMLYWWLNLPIGVSNHTQKTRLCA